jgi:hypothetical protein
MSMPHSSAASSGSVSHGRSSRQVISDSERPASQICGHTWFASLDGRPQPVSLLLQRDSQLGFETGGPLSPSSLLHAAQSIIIVITRNCRVFML